MLINTKQVSLKNIFMKKPVSLFLPHFLSIKLFLSKKGKLRFRESLPFKRMHASGTAQLFHLL